MKILNLLIILIISTGIAVIFFVYSSEYFRDTNGTGHERIGMPLQYSTPQQKNFALIKKPAEENILSSKPNMQEIKKQPKKSIFPIKEFAVLGGFASGNLKEQKDYEFIPIIVRFGFDIVPLLQEGKINPKGLFEFEIEPFVGILTSPDSNMEAGVNLLFKSGYFITRRFCPFIELGAGLLYMTQHTKEQSTQFNFVPQAGFGVSYFIKNNIALDAGYRYRHLSNASIKHPNGGIESNMVIAGISLFF